jgi:hypothetical protein
LPEFPDSKPAEIEFNVEIISTAVSAFKIPIAPLEPKQEKKEENVAETPANETASKEEKAKEKKEKAKDEKKEKTES